MLCRWVTAICYIPNLRLIIYKLYETLTSETMKFEVCLHVTL